MNTVLRSIDQFTPDYLTHLLRHNGALAHGHVTEIVQTGTRHMASLNYFVTVRFSPDMSGDVPQRLFLKLSRPERLPLNDAEVAYYNRVAAAMPDPPTPRCYDAQFDPASGAYHILLEDVSRTHGPNDFPLPPRRVHAEMMVDEMAKFHAFWWQHPDLDGGVAALPSQEVIERYIGYSQSGLQPMIDFMGDRLTQAQRAVLERVFERHRAVMIQRGAHREHLTLIHGDSHTGNFLLPHQPHGRAYMIDRQPFDWSLTCWLGVSDLAYMMVHWWFPEVRRALEIPLLRRYLNQLHQSGIQHYSWEQLWLDYRLCAMQSFYVAVNWCCDDPPSDNAWLWYPQLQHTLTAYDDLKCAELLE